MKNKVFIKGNKSIVIQGVNNSEISIETSEDVEKYLQDILDNQKEIIDLLKNYNNDKINILKEVINNKIIKYRSYNVFFFLILPILSISVSYILYKVAFGYNFYIFWSIFVFSLSCTAIRISYVLYQQTHLNNILLVISPFLYAATTSFTYLQLTYPITLGVYDETMNRNFKKIITVKSPQLGNGKYNEDDSLFYFQAPPTLREEDSITYQPYFFDVPLMPKKVLYKNFKKGIEVYQIGAKISYNGEDVFLTDGIVEGKGKVWFDIHIVDSHSHWILENDKQIERLKDTINIQDYIKNKYEDNDFRMETRDIIICLGTSCEIGEDKGLSEKRADNVAESCKIFIKKGMHKINQKIYSLYLGQYKKMETKGYVIANNSTNRTEQNKQRRIILVGVWAMEGKFEEEDERKALYDALDKLTKEKGKQQLGFDFKKFENVDNSSKTFKQEFKIHRR